MGHVLPESCDGGYRVFSPAVQELMAAGKKPWPEMSSWRPPAGWTRVRYLDAHTAGEPLRIITDGWPALPGETILARRRFAQQHHDQLRTALMWEPRGHADMYGCIITPPTTETADFGVLFLHNEGFSTMCGHGIIAVTTVVVETGMIKAADPSPTDPATTVKPETTVRIDTPAGLVTATAHCQDDRVVAVSFQNVPSFVLALDQQVEVPGIGQVAYDLAFGGAFYAYVQADSVGVDLVPASQSELIDIGMRIKRAVMASRRIEHPEDEDLGFLYGTIFVGPARNEPRSAALTLPGQSYSTASALGEPLHSRNVCIFAEGEVDRSPTGTGVSGRLAIHQARGEIAQGQPIVVESILGTSFTGYVVGEAKCGSHSAIIPEVVGSAHLTGAGEFWLDPHDPLRHGFLLR